MRPGPSVRAAASRPAAGRAAASAIRGGPRATLPKFLAVGAIGALVNLGALSLLLAAGVNKYVASPIGIELAILSNFLLHRRWTFAHREVRDDLWRRGLRFKAVALLALGASYATFVLLSWAWPALPPQVAQAAGIPPGTLVNYLGNSCWTFRPRDVA